MTLPTSILSHSTSILSYNSIILFGGFPYSASVLLSQPQRCLIGLRSSLEFTHFQPLLDHSAGVLGVIILLKDNVRRIETIILQGFLKFIIQNLKVEIPIHPIIHPNSKTNSLSSHMTPHSPLNLRVPSTSLSQSPSPALFHVHLHSSDPRQLIFRPYYLFLILYSVILVGISIVQVSFSMFSRKRGHLDFTMDFILAFFKWKWIVFVERGWMMILLSTLVT